MSDQFHRARRLATVSGVALALAAGLIAAPQAAAAQERAQATHQLNIPAGLLEASLVRLAEITGVQLVYSSQVTANLRAPAVSGRMDAATAVSRLLAGSGLTYRFVDDRTVTIERPLGGVDPDGSRILGPVRIEGASGQNLRGATAVNGVNGSRDVTATEATESYTSNALTVGSKAAVTLQEVPQSISVITAQRMEDQVVTDFSDALKQAPGITLIQGETGLDYEFYSRGFEITSIQIDGGAPYEIGSSPVQQIGRVDAGYFPQIDMAMYDHVEVLRGASGVFNGYGDPSGSVNLVRKKPLDHPQFLFEAQVGSWNTYRAVLDATAPLGFDGRLRGRTVLTYQDNEYFYDLASDTRNLVYGVLEFDLTPATLLTAGVSHTSQLSLPFSSGLPRYENGDDLQLPRNTSFAFPWNRWDISTTEVFGSLERTFHDNWIAKLNLNYVTQDSERKIGSVGVPVNPLSMRGPITFGALSDYRVEKLSAEFTLTGGFVILGQRQDIAIGVNRSSSDGGRGRLSYGSLGFTGRPVDVFDFDPFDPAYREPGTPLPNSRTVEALSTQTGAYVNLRLTAFDRVHLNLGGRYSETSAEGRTQRLCTSIPASGTPSPTNCVGKQIGDVRQETTYANDSQFFSFPQTAALSVDLPRNFTAYAGYSDVYVPQFNRLDINSEPSHPITGSNLEAGLKWQARDGRLNASIAAYRIEQEGFVIYDLDAIFIDEDGFFYAVDSNGVRYPDGIVAPGIDCCYITDSDVQLFSEGLDFELSGEILPGLQLSTSYTYNDNELRGEDIALLAISFIQGKDAPIVSLQPRHLFKLWASYEVPGEGWARGLTVGGGVNYQSSAFAAGSVCTEFTPLDPDGNSLCVPDGYESFSFTQPAYDIWSLRAEYELSPVWSVSLNLENIFDEHYYKQTGTSDGGNWYGEPAGYTLTLRGRW